MQRVSHGTTKKGPFTFLSSFEWIRLTEELLALDLKFAKIFDGLFHSWSARSSKDEPNERCLHSQSRVQKGLGGIANPAVRR